MDTDVLDVDTTRRRIVDLTDAVREFCGNHADGLCNVFVPHATAGWPSSRRAPGPTTTCWTH